MQPQKTEKEVLEYRIKRLNKLIKITMETEYKPEQLALKEEMIDALEAQKQRRLIELEALTDGDFNTEDSQRLDMVNTWMGR